VRPGRWLLGLISMEKIVRVWISLRLRVNPRTEG
jgi:hypothetical protein